MLLASALGEGYGVEHHNTAPPHLPENRHAQSRLPSSISEFLEAYNNTYLLARLQPKKNLPRQRLAAEVQRLNADI